MATIVFMAVLLLVLAIIVFALVILIGFAYLQIKTLEKLFEQDYVPVPTPSHSFPQKDSYTPDYAPGEVPLEQFTPDFKKPVSLKFTETEEGHGVEEVEG